MRALKIASILLLCTFTLNGCNLIDGFIYKEQVVGRYYLIAVDSYEDLNLSYETDNVGYIGVIPETTVAFWNDNKYIVVKNYENNNKLLEKFYIIPVKFEYTYFPEEGVIGPLAKDQFLIKLEELNISSDIKLKAVR